MTKLLASTAVDCKQFNKGLNFDCYECHPTDGSPVFMPDLDKDMLYESPCANQNIKVKEFTLNGSLYYVDNAKKIYTKKGDNYIQIIDPDVLEYIHNQI